MIEPIDLLFQGGIIFFDGNLPKTVADRQAPEECFPDSLSLDDQVILRIDYRLALGNRLLFEVVALGRRFFCRLLRVRSKPLTKPLELLDLSAGLALSSSLARAKAGVQRLRTTSHITVGPSKPRPRNGILRLGSDWPLPGRNRPWLCLGKSEEGHMPQREGCVQRNFSLWFKKGSGTFAGTARRVLRTKVPDPFLNPVEEVVMRRIFLVFVVVAACLPLAVGRTPDQGAPIRYLQELQTSGGGFLASRTDLSQSRGEAPGLRATSAALRGLRYLGGEVRDRKSCTQFVHSCYDQTSGGFADRPGGQPDVITTATGIMAVVELKMPVKDYDGAIKYLGERAKSFEEVRMAAAGLEAIGQLPPQSEAWRQQIAAMQNSDGTFGKGNGAARATAGAAVILLRLGGTLEHPEAIKKALTTGQRLDGGFGKEGAKTSDLETCYRVVRALVMVKEKPADPEACRRFVGRCRNADGGFARLPANLPVRQQLISRPSSSTGWRRNKRAAG